MLAVSGDQQHPFARQVHAVNEDLIVDLPGDGRVGVFNCLCIRLFV